MQIILVVAKYKKFGLILPTGKYSVKKGIILWHPVIYILKVVGMSFKMRQNKIKGIMTSFC